jgi:mannose-6-phosphate isomerase-like protein (cupin superfamily)
MVKYTVIYADETGESHFRDVDIKFVPVEFAPPAPPINLSSFHPATQYAFCLFPAGWYGDWHPAPHKQIFFILSGESEAQVSDGEVRRFGPGSILLVEDTSGKGHVSRVVGSKDIVVAVVQLPAS